MAGFIYELMRPRRPSVDIMTNDVRLHSGYLWIRYSQTNERWLCTYEKRREDVERRIQTLGLEQYLHSIEQEPSP